MGTGSKSQVAGYAPHVVVATFFVALFPLIVVFALESSRTITSPLVATIVGVGLSVGIARLGSFMWMRHSGSRDLVFGDLMLWGWLRRMRTEKRLSNAKALLDIDRSTTGIREVELSPERQSEILRDLASALETGDPFTHGHTRRVTRYAYMVAKTMRLPEDDVRRIRAAASIHDVGKVETPLEVLDKPGPLTDEEFEIMKRHSTVGAAMVEKLGDPEITAMVRHHHERLDGKGYPDNLVGDEIPLGARVIAVADTFDAIVSTRPYRKARRHKEAIEVLERAAGTQLDERAVYAFLSYYSGRKPLAWWLSFSAGFQRVLGGMGGWLQHAQAASHGTLSLAAAVALTSAAVTMPALSHLRDRVGGREKGTKIVATEDSATGLSVVDAAGYHDNAPDRRPKAPSSGLKSGRAQDGRKVAWKKSDRAEGAEGDLARKGPKSLSTGPEDAPGDAPTDGVNNGDNGNHGEGNNGVILEKPVKPVRPEKPVSPVKPVKPVSPERPEKPVDPVTPDMPDNSVDKPAKPDTANDGAEKARKANSASGK